MTRVHGLDKVVTVQRLSCHTSLLGIPYMEQADIEMSAFIFARVKRRSFCLLRRACLYRSGVDDHHLQGDMIGLCVNQLAGLTNR